MNSLPHLLCYRKIEALMWYQKSVGPIFCFIDGQQRKVFIIIVFSKSKYYLRLERQVRCTTGHHFGAKGIEIP